MFRGEFMRSKYVSLLGLSWVAIALAGCQQVEKSSFSPDVVNETYVHRYGVPVSPKEWSDSGHHGQILSSLANGVVVTKTYNSGVLDGDTTYSYPHSSAIEKVETYANGVLQKTSVFYLSGAPQEEIFYHTPQNRTVLTWYESGDPKSKEEFQGNLLFQGSYYGPDNQLESQVVNYHGKRIRRDNYGLLISVDTIEKGQQTLRTTYHQNGTPKEVIPYANGRIHGQLRTYMPAGEPCTKEEWNNGVQSGITIEYANGEKIAEVPYVEGRKHGVERRYRDGETVVQETSWVKGQKHGPCTSYIGNTTKTDWYWQDKQVTKSHYELLNGQGSKKAIWRSVH
ncbi:Uncharacterized protein NEOC95_001807 [Neochlamydia sp. AcF95]|nr:Uncharacterized protein [Neochlamydia sp. AcF95]